MYTLNVRLYEAVGGDAAVIHTEMCESGGGDWSRGTCIAPHTQTCMVAAQIIMTHTQLHTRLCCPCILLIKDPQCSRRYLSDECKDKCCYTTEVYMQKLTMD